MRGKSLNSRRKICDCKANVDCCHVTFMARLQSISLVFFLESRRSSKRSLECRTLKNIECESTRTMSISCVIFEVGRGRRSGLAGRVTRTKEDAFSSSVSYALRTLRTGRKASLRHCFDRFLPHSIMHPVNYAQEVITCPDIYLPKHGPAIQTEECGDVIQLETALICKIRYEWKAGFSRR